MQRPLTAVLLGLTLGLAAATASLTGCDFIDGVADCDKACDKVFGDGGCLDGEAPAGSHTACLGKCANESKEDRDSMTACLNGTSCDDPAILECVDLE